MVDLHCHILSGIDDGAKELQDSIAMLRAEVAQGIRSVVFTPHFNLEKLSVEDFSALRNENLKLLQNSEEFKELNVTIKTGAEVYYSPMLYSADLEQLCIQDTDYILIELPVASKPYEMNNVIHSIINRGYTPILAHVERYPYFTENPVLLYNLVLEGCLAQVNAGAIIGKGNQSVMAMKYLKWELAQIVCSDCHSIDRRPPNIDKALDVINKKLGSDYIDWLDKNSSDIFNNRSVDLPVIQKPKKVFGFWK
ncbi:MAG: CpsB/CapC family capsule biosynthesis tyrosine phosphatase [Acutalibacteraceae bacterium]|nr:CpsB/CapC family capsule biosynthesis tyrosine phosphatase [Acutalibacteraceae bacterium]